MKNIFETLVGAIVLLVALGFTVIAYQSGNVSADNGYLLTARFDRVDGLSMGSDVRVSGLKVGSVVSQDIDPKTYVAVITMSVDDEVKLPSDSSAEILGDGLLGSKYIALIPGGASDVFKNNDEVKFTQSAVSIESLIGKFIFGSAEEKSESEEAEEDIF